MSPRSSLPLNVMGETDAFKVAELFKIQFKDDSPLGPSKDPPKSEQLYSDSYSRLYEVYSRLGQSGQEGHDMFYTLRIGHPLLIYMILYGQLRPL